MNLVTDALACARLTRLITTDRITERPRFALTRWTDKRAPILSELLDCDWCTSVWVGFGVVAARRLAPRAWSPVAQALAFSAVAGWAAAHE